MFESTGNGNRRLVYREVTENHRKIWAKYSRRPDLWRVLDPTGDLRKQPITLREAIFARSVIFQFNCTYYASKDDLIIKHEGLRRDVFEFLSLPTQMATWKLIKDKQKPSAGCAIVSTEKTNSSAPV